MSNLMAINGNIIGGLPIASENLRLLWENPAPTSSFAAQSITLSEDDYDFLMITYRSHASDATMLSEIFKKGEDSIITLGSINESGAFCASRSVTYTSSTSLTLGSCAYCIGSAAPVGNDDFLIPVEVYGIYKKSIANTEASKCMLSDGTSVEDAITSTSTYQATAASGYTLAINRIETRSGWCAATLIFSNVTLAAGSAWVKVATTPIKPAYDVFGSVYDGNNVRIIGESRIDSNGNVYVCLSTAASNIYLPIYLTFMVA